MRISSVSNLSAKILSAKKKLPVKGEPIHQRVLPKAISPDEAVATSRAQRNLNSCGYLSDSCGGTADFCGAYM